MSLIVSPLPLTSIIPRLYKYYTTGGTNHAANYLGIGSAPFSLFYRNEFGPVQQFRVYTQPFPSQQTYQHYITGGYLLGLPTTTKRHSLYLDTLLDDRYDFQLIDSLQAAILTSILFSPGNTDSEKHAAYKKVPCNGLLPPSRKKVRLPR